MSTDAAPPLPTPILPYRSKTYSAIDPTKPEVSSKGKTILITGGGAGIGKATALSFAKSGAAHIGIIGRRANLLDSVKKEIESAYPDTKVYTFAGDLVDTASITSAVHNFGAALKTATSNQDAKIDVLVAGAGYLNDLVSFDEIDPQDFWYTFEANVKGSFDLLRAFGPLAAPDAVVLNVSSGAAWLPCMPGANNMPYVSSKIAAIRVFDYFAGARPGIRLVHLHPGIVGTEMGNKAADAGAGFPFDDG